MKNFAIIAASAVVAGLIAYAILKGARLVSLNTNGDIILRISVFVGTLAVVGFLSGALALLMSAEIRRADRQLVRRLEERLERIELSATLRGESSRETA